MLTVSVFACIWPTASARCRGMDGGWCGVSLWPDCGGIMVWESAGDEERAGGCDLKFVTWWCFKQQHCHCEMTRGLGSDGASVRECE